MILIIKDIYQQLFKKITNKRFIYNNIQLKIFLQLFLNLNDKFLINRNFKQM